MSSLRLTVFFLIVALSLGFDMDPDVTLNRKLDPELSKDDSTVRFRVSYDGKNTEILNHVNGSHWTLEGEHTSDAELEPYRPKKTH